MKRFRIDSVGCIYTMSWLYVNLFKIRILTYTIMTAMNTSLYFHIPFCTHRCAYCDFNTYAGQEEMIPAYVNALIQEVEHVGFLAERSGSEVEAHTIFFGGGTPSLLL